MSLQLNRLEINTCPEGLMFVEWNLGVLDHLLVWESQ